MARTSKEMASVNRAKAVAESEVAKGGGVTFRVAVDHPDDNHDVLPVTAHYGPAYDAAYANVVAEVKDVPAGDVDLLEEARKGAERARRDYPESDGYVVSIEALVPSDDGEAASWRKVG